MRIKPNCVVVVVYITNLHCDRVAMLLLYSPGRSHTYHIQSDILLQTVSLCGWSIQRYNAYNIGHCLFLPRPDSCLIAASCSLLGFRPMSSIISIEPMMLSMRASLPRSLASHRSELSSTLYLVSKDIYRHKGQRLTLNIS